MKVLIIFVTLTIIQSASFAQENQLKNSGFEQENEAWNYFGGEQNSTHKNGAYG